MKGKTETIIVKGMFCANCERRVQKALLFLPGVQSAAASFSEETVKVTYDETVVRPQLLRQEIEKLGYETAADSSRNIQIVSVLIIMFITTLVAVYGAKYIGKAQIIAVVCLAILSVWIAIRIFSLVSFKDICCVADTICCDIGYERMSDAFYIMIPVAIIHLCC